MVTCGNCGSAVPEGAETCPQCGASLAGESARSPGESQSEGDGGDGSTGTGDDREISSDEAESGTTRIYGFSESEGAEGSRADADGEGGRREHRETPRRPPDEPEESRRRPDDATAAGETAVQRSSTESSQAADASRGGKPSDVGPEASDPPRGSRPTRESADDKPLRNRRRILGGLGLLGLGAGGWYAMFGRDGGGGGIPSVQEMELSMGLLAPVSGGLRKIGPGYRDGAELVAQQVNEESPDVTVATSFEDTASDAQEGVGAAQSLVDAGSPMLCGAIATGISAAIAEEVAIPNRIPMVSPSSRGPAFTAFDADYTFRTTASTVLQGRAMATVARERVGVESVATLFPPHSGREVVANAFAESFREAGGTITDMVTYEDGRDSYVEPLEVALGGDPAALVVDGNPRTGTRIFDDFYSQFDRGDMPIVVSDVLSDESIPGAVRHDMSNVRGTYPDPDEPSEEFVESQYEETYSSNRSAPPSANRGYDAAATLVLARVAAGESDGEAIRDQIRPVTDSGGTEITAENLVEGVHRAANGEEIEYRGAAGEIRFDENGEQTGVSFDLFRFTSEGERETVETFELG